MARDLTKKFLSGKLGSIIVDGTAISSIINSWGLEITSESEDTTTLSAAANLQGKSQVTKIMASGTYSGFFKKDQLSNVEVGKSAELKLIIDSATNVSNQTGAINNVGGYPAGTVAGTSIAVDGLTLAPAEGTLLRFAGHGKVYTADALCTTTVLFLKEDLEAALTDDEVAFISGSGSYIFGGFQFSSLNISSEVNGIVKVSGTFAQDGLFFKDYEGIVDDYDDPENVKMAYGNAQLYA